MALPSEIFIVRECLLLRAFELFSHHTPTFPCILGIEGLTCWFSLVWGSCHILEDSLPALY